MIRSYDNSGSLISIAGPRLGDPRNGPTNIELQGYGFDNVYEVRFTTSGGTPAGLGGTGYQLVMDDMRVRR